MNFQIKEVAPGKTRNQHRLWEHDIKIARNYNTTTNTNEDSMTRHLSEEISELRNNEGRFKSLYRQSYQQTWSPMSSNIPSSYSRDTIIRDLEGISLCMEYPTVGSFDISTYSQRNDYTKRRASLPYISKPTRFRASSIVSDLHIAKRFRLEKIPEVPSGSASNEHENEDNSQNVDDSSHSSNSDNSHKPIVEPDKQDDTK